MWVLFTTHWDQNWIINKNLASDDIRSHTGFTFLGQEIPACASTDKRFERFRRPHKPKTFFPLVEEWPDRFLNGIFRETSSTGLLVWRIPRSKCNLRSLSQRVLRKIRLHDWWLAVLSFEFCPAAKLLKKCTDVRHEVFYETISFSRTIGGAAPSNVKSGCQMRCKQRRGKGCFPRILAA